MSASTDLQTLDVLDRCLVYTEQYTLQQNYHITMHVSWHI